MLTGDDYRKSLLDGRETFFEGRRVEDIGAEPALDIAVRSVAAGYDRHYAAGPDARNPLMEAPRSIEELRDRIPMLHAVDVLTNVTYQSLMTLFTVGGRMAEGSEEFIERMHAYVDDARARDIRITECITDAKGNRANPPSRQTDPDAYVHVVDRQRDGVVIRGAKLHITGASLGHDLMVMPTKNMKAGEEEYAIACAVPVNAPGVRIVNTTYAPRVADARHFPVSSRNAIPDGFVVFDDVFVPNERIFLDGQGRYAAVFAHSLGLWERLGGIAFMVEEADEMVGAAQLIAEANGTAGIAHIQEKISELVIHATMLRAGLESAITHAERTPEGYFYPNELFTNAAKFQGAAQYNLMVRHLHDIAGGAVLTAPALSDFDNPDTGPSLRKYMSTMDGVDGEYRARLFHLIRDLTADAYGGWRFVTNIQSGGGLFAQRLVTRKHYDMDRAKQIALRSAGIEE
ncbi:4-hydroxyphenylacetate 3-hydroxylase N-terminal domain-containing protein [Desertimonas flava]|uniref:4-hydroxyphenylacetate 3-hydroxylase N-terminal domain-containing protein n=1 Tax=Desertimonas flava TaxID=2064846 RepID=UPI000E347792|nr:4-hydroxyphenylacetate 3-hydroxylase N-terminal domain-containing protein [Desertimonas flava]